MTRRQMTWRRSLAVLLMSALPGCQAPRQLPNVLVIVADTLRADRLGCYGNTQGLTPFLDVLARRSTVFQHAYTNSPWTLPSIATLFTSRFASQHGVITRESVLPDDEITLAEVLQARGYVTGAVTANGLMRPQGGLGQGFDLFDVLWLQGDNTKVPAELVNRVALAWLDGLRRGMQPAPPVFLYLQYMEPHLPYLPAPKALERVLAGRPAPDLAELNALTPILPLHDQLDQLLPGLWDGYNASVATLDTAIYGLFVELGQRHFLDDAVVVLTADHGEEFKEHGRFGHGEDLYNEVVHVPLLAQFPGDTQHADVPDVVSLLDVAPTILARLGIPAPARFLGTPWTPAAPGTAGAPRPTFIELIPTPGNETPAARAVVLAHEKRIVADDGAIASYDLATDPREKNPRGLDAGQNQALQQLLVAFRERAGRPDQPLATQPLDDAARARLRALGYTQ